jgi:hypothetical protein
MEYSGQKLMTLVSVKMAATASAIILSVPVRVPVKYNAMAIAATIRRIMRSVPPMFGFMIEMFLVFNSFDDKIQTNQKCGANETYRDEFCGG